MQLANGCVARRPVACLFALITFLATCTPPTATTPTEIPGVVARGDDGNVVDLQRLTRWPRLRARPAVDSTGEAPRASSRRSAADSKPRLGDQNKPMAVGREEVIIGQIILEGTLPLSIQADVGICAVQALATVASVPVSHVVISVTAERCTGQCLRNVVKFHFILLPLKGASSGTVAAINEAAVSVGSVAPFLIILAREMRDVDILEDYYVLALQWSIRMPLPSVSELEIWRPEEYGRSPGAPEQGPTTKPMDKGTPPPADPDACSTTYTPCNCAAISACAWVEDLRTGISSCAKSTYGNSGVPCVACPAQSRCKTDGCLEVSNPCDCASSSYSCRWDEGKNSCQSGSGTSCVACARQSQCADAVPKLVSYMPLSGTYMKPTEGQLIRLGFDREVYFIAGGGGLTSFFCEGQVVPVEISRPRMKISINYLILDIQGLFRTASGIVTNNARKCNLVIEEGLVSDQYGVPFLGLRVGRYSVDFGDTVAPEVLAFSPKNGDTDVDPTAVVTLTFSEPIVLAPGAENMKAELNRLEAGESLTPVAQLDLKPPVVRVEDAQLKVDLSGRIEPGFLYTLSLPSGAVADLEQNTFWGLEPRAYVFRTTGKVSHSGTSGLTTGVPLSSLIAVGGALILVLGSVILAGWWFVRLRMAQKKLQQEQRARNKLSGVKNFFDDSSGKPSLKRASTMSSMRSGNSSIHAEDGMSHANTSPGGHTPKGQVPLDAFEETFGSDTADLFDPFKPPMRRSETWAPGKMAELSQKHRSSEPTVTAPSGTSHHRSHRNSERSERGGSKERPRERSSSEGASQTERSQASVRSVKEAAARQWQQHTEAKKRWHSAFAQAAAKRAAAPGMPPMHPRQIDAELRAAAEARNEGGAPDAEGSPSRSKTSTASTATAGASGTSEGGQGKSTNSANAEAQAPKASRERSKGEASPSAEAKNAGRDSHGGGRSSSHITAPSPSDSPELRRQKEEVERRMRELMDSPIADRKKVLKELMLEYHPDKNGDQYAKEIFQFVNASRGWFLCET